MKDFAALQNGDRRALATAITLFESTRAEHRLRAEKLLRAMLPHSGTAKRIGVSGAPGVGKSTFIESLGGYAIARGHKVAVLTIDPSSSRSGGSILGDKTRMQKLAANPNAFIRPSPAGAQLGGVGRRTREAILACEAANFDWVIVETVGVGQSETLVAEMTDIFMLLLQPAGGDELQGIKRGIMELADLVVVNKSDGALAKQAAATHADISHALGLLQPRLPNWKVPVLRASGLENTGMDAVCESLEQFWDALNATGHLSKRRRAQTRDWLLEEIQAQLVEGLQRHHGVAQWMDDALGRVEKNQVTASGAARELVSRLLADENFGNHF